MTSEVTQAAYLIEAEKQYTPKSMPDNGSDAGCSISKDIKDCLKIIRRIIDDELYNEQIANESAEDELDCCEDAQNASDALDRLELSIQTAEQRGREKALDEAATLIETYSIATNGAGCWKLAPRILFDQHFIQYAEAIRNLKQVKP